MNLSHVVKKVDTYNVLYDRLRRERAAARNAAFKGGPKVCATDKKESGCKCLTYKMYTPYVELFVARTDNGRLRHGMYVSPW